MAATTTAETIRAAMEEIDPKKQKLKKAFDDLQSLSPDLVLSVFSLSWPHLDAHFTSLHSSLSQKLLLLQTLESQHSQNSQSDPTQLPPADDKPTHVPKIESFAPKQPTRKTVKAVKTGGVGDAELVRVCEAMDAVGLQNYINGSNCSRNTMRSEIMAALRGAPDAAMLVLEMMEGLLDVETASVRRMSVLFIEVLCEEVGLSVGEETREKAKKVAREWKGRISLEGESQFEAMGFLHFLVAFGIAGEFDGDEIVEFMAAVARNKQAIHLCERLGLGEDKLADLIQKLINKNKHLLATKFISKFSMSDKFPPVPLLQEYVKESKWLAKKIAEEGSNSKKNEAIAKETNALKAAIKVIEDLKLESEYPLSSLEKRIEQLENEKANRKRQAEATPAGKPVQSQRQLRQQQYGNKRPRMVAPVHSTAVSNSAAGLLVHSPTVYMSSAAGPYVVAGRAPPVAPYVGSSTGQYAYARDQMGFTGNPGPSSTHLYSSQQYVVSGYPNRLTAYDEYSVPQYHPSYYSQQ